MANCTLCPIHWTYVFRPRFRYVIITMGFIWLRFGYALITMGLLRFRYVLIAMVLLRFKYALINMGFIGVYICSHYYGFIEV